MARIVPVDLFSIFRPFRDPLPHVAVPFSTIAEKQPDETSLIVLGGKVTIIQLNQTYASTLQVTYNNKQKAEVERKFDVVKIKNKEDETQYVEAEVTKEQKLDYTKQSGGGGTGNNWQTVKYGEIKEEDNIEIVKKDQKRTYDPKTGNQTGSSGENAGDNSRAAGEYPGIGLAVPVSGA